MSQENTVADRLLQDARRRTAKTESPKLGKFKIINQPVKLSRTPAKLVTATPERGEHTNEVLREAGYDDAAIADLRRNGII